MRIEITIPEWISDGSVTVRLAELNPHAVEALIESPRDANKEDDDRVRLLLKLWDALTRD